MNTVPFQPLIPEIASRVSAAGKKSNTPVKKVRIE
jgi:hypothetical protein